VGDLPGSDAEADRHARIFEAAERAFVREGFQGASMQAIAAEAKMSAGNLYRYFPSKEAIVSGLVARDQATIAQEFRSMAQAEDIFAVLGRMLRRHLVDAPIERHRLIITIWAEMARNPAIREHCGGVDNEVRQHLVSLVERARRSGIAAADIDPDFVVRLMATVVSGLFKRRATEPGFDGEAELALALGAFRAAFEGVLKPYGARSGEAHS
jgi:TetR/AcrR family transcriptional repressor of uid operon